MSVLHICVGAICFIVLFNFLKKNDTRPWSWYIMVHVCGHGPSWYTSLVMVHVGLDLLNPTIISSMVSLSALLSPLTSYQVKCVRTSTSTYCDLWYTTLICSQVYRLNHRHAFYTQHNDSFILFSQACNKKCSQTVQPLWNIGVVPMEKL